MTVNRSSNVLTLPFAFYLLGLSTSALAESILAIALPFAVLASSGTQVMLAAVMVSGSLPRFVAPVLGALADRLHPGAVLFFIGVTRALTLAALGWVALGGRVPFGLFIVFAFFNGLLVTLTLATGRVLVPRLVPESALARANSLTTMAMQGLPLVGYGVGGVLVKAFGSDMTLLLIAPLYLLMGLVAFTLRHALVAEAQPRQFHLGRDLLEGWQVVRASRVLLIMLLGTLMLNLALNVVNVRAPIFSSEVGRGADDYALLKMLFSAGALVGIVLVGFLNHKVKITTQISLGYVLFAVGVMVLVVPRLAVWFGAQVAVGVSVGLLDVATMTLTQRLVTDGLRGRVGGILIGAGAIGLNLGAVAGGLAIRTTDLMLGLGIGSLLLTMAWLRWARD